MKPTLLKMLAACAAALCFGTASPARAQEVKGAAQPGGDAIVLMTVRPKDPFSPTLISMPVAYAHQALSQEEARQHMRPNWVGPARQHVADSGTVLHEVPLMTRQRLVEAALAAYEKLGGKRSDVRVDVLSAGSAARRAATGAQAGTAALPTQDVTATTTAVAQASTPSRSAYDRACLAFRPSAKADQRGEANYFFIRNGCGGPTIVARGRNARSCWPGGTLRPGVEDEFHIGDVFAICVHPSSVSVDQAIGAQVDCRCPAGATSVTHPAFTKTAR